MKSATEAHSRAGANGGLLYKSFSTSVTNSAIRLR
jgi:hypothetical protein